MPTLIPSPQSGPPYPFRIDVDPDAGRIAVTGDLDRATCDQVVGACRQLALAGPPIWLLDLAGVTFCDAPGLRSLMCARHAAEDVEAILVVAGAGPFLRSLLSRYGFDGVLTPTARTAPVPAARPHELLRRTEPPRTSRPSQVAP